MSFTSPTPQETLKSLEARGPRANPYRAGRSLTVCEHGLVCSSHSLASLAGVDMLRRGGTAMDAAIAAAATLAVVEPMMTGLGGDAFFLYFDAQSGRVCGLNGSGRAPRSLTLEAVLEVHSDAIATDSWHSVTVPGAVDAWSQGLQRFGRLSFAQVLEPAIGYASNGFPVGEVVHSVWTAHETTLLDDPQARRTYLVGDRSPRLGEIFKNRRLAVSLEVIARDGAETFYRGQLAEEIVRYSRSQGGFFDLDDFASHRSEWVDPISTRYREYEVLQLPPNGQGLAVLLMLNLLEGDDIGAMQHNSPEYLHLLVEAKKIAYADAHRFVADPDARSVPVTGLLSKSYAAERRRLIDPRRARSSVDPGQPQGQDTVYLTAIDTDGNAVSFINSLFDAFGAKKVGGETGILLHNRGCGFSLEPGHPNVYGPGQRPFHTIIPGMVLLDGRLYLSYGVMGGPMQPQGHVQFLLSHLDFGLTIQEATDTPRWRHIGDTLLLMEHGTPHSTMDALRRLGHNVVPSDGSEFGGAQAILVDPETGTYFGASDPRKDGAAIGY